MRKYGLIGKKLGYTFSPNYFKKIFESLGITDAEYKAYELPSIDEVEKLFAEGFAGFNVTIPYKKEIIPFLDELDPSSEKIGAVNCVKKIAENRYRGYNTDWIGFKDSLLPILDFSLPNKAFVLGNGGASKAIVFTLEFLQIPYEIVSRKEGYKKYESITEQELKEYNILINTTPLGMYPDVESKPLLPYNGINRYSILYDLNYNPEETAFLKEGIIRNATVKNGYDMLQIQADESWKIWNENI